MTSVPLGGIRRWHTIYSYTVATVSLLGLFTWVAFCLVWVFISGISVGDGAMRSESSPAISVFCIPLLYLVIVAGSALPFVSGWPFVVATVFGQLILIAGLYSIAHAGLDAILMRIALIVFVAIDALWLGLYGVKFRSDA